MFLAFRGRPCIAGPVLLAFRAVRSEVGRDVSIGLAKRPERARPGCLHIVQGVDDELADLEALMAPSGLRVNMMLCDSAQAMNGRLFMLGGGLSVIGPKPQPLAIAIHVTVPWDRANIAHEWTLELVDEDGRPVTMNEKPVRVTGKFEAGRPAGLRAGTPLGVALAINLTALRLRPGIGYSFVYSVDGESRPEWRTQLFVRAQ